jgi:protein involved in polysaccharide export with SLBB domain
MKYRYWPLLVLLPLGVSKGQQQKHPTTPLAGDTVSLVLRSGDVVRLRIWREPDLSGDFVIDETGVAVFPKIGAVQIVGVNSSAVRSSLIKSYLTYLRNPSVEVIFLRRINVLGAVMRPGLYPVDPTMTLADVLALAGGATPLGKPDQVQLLRGDKTLNATLGTTTRVADLEMQSGDQLFVPERSWITRNSGVVAAALTASVSLLIAVFR